MSPGPAEVIEVVLRMVEGGLSDVLQVSMRGTIDKHLTGLHDLDDL